MGKLKAKKIKARIKVMRVLQHQGSPIYIRMIDGEIFTYDLIFQNELYSSYLVIKPAKGQKKLKPEEVEKAIALIYSGAVATIRTLLGDQVKGEEKKRAEIVSSLAN